jgi:hypothetical protein
MSTEIVPSAHHTSNIILGALKTNQTPEKWESDFVKKAIHWDDLSIRAIVFGLAPLLHHRFSQWGYDLPPRAAAKLAANYLAHEERNQRIANQLGEVLTACDDKRLHPVALKGVHLAARIYPDPALRPMNDIDLLFSPQEIREAGQVLEQLGYGGKHKSPESGAGVTKHTSTFRRDAPTGATPNPYLSTNAEAMVEPHTSLEESWFGLKVNITPGIMERAQMVTLFGHPCQVLEPTDLLLHLCIHFCFHLIMGAPAMVQLVDLGTVIQKGDIDWATFVARSSSCRAAPFVLAGLTLAEKLLGAQIPDFVTPKLKSQTPGPLVARIAGLDLSHILKRTQQKPMTSIQARLRRGIADRRETAQWAPDFRAQFQVWSTLLTFWRTDTGRMLLHNEK